MGAGGSEEDGRKGRTKKHSALRGEGGLRSRSGMLLVEQSALLKELTWG